MSAVCEPHKQLATLVVVYYEPIPNDPDGYDVYPRLACSPECCDPLWSGRYRSWLALTPQLAENITGDASRPVAS